MTRTLPAQLAERRAEVRIEVELPARIATGSGVTIGALVRNISTGGVLVHLDAAHSAALLPNVERELRHIPVCVHLEFRLPDGEREALVQVDCGIVHLRRVRPGTDAMGLGFRHFHAGSDSALARFCAP